MNIALVISGGVGKRTGNIVPKQYLSVNDIPVIVYTMQNIEKSGCFDALYVVCNSGWTEFVRTFAEQYNISIFKETIDGGETRLLSCANGISRLHALYEDDIVVSLVDGNRPLIPKRVFEESLMKITSADSVIPVEPSFDTLYMIQNNSEKVDKMLDRKSIYKGQGPETIRVGLAYEIYSKAVQERWEDLPLTAMLLKEEKNVAYINGSSKSFKITTNDDFAIFKSMIST